MELGAEPLPPQPPLKRRRSTFDFIREKQLREGQATQATQPGPRAAAEELAVAAAAVAAGPLVPLSASEPPPAALYKQDSILEEVGGDAAQEVECAEEAARFDAVARHRSKQLEAKFRLLQRRDSKPSEEPILTSSEDISADFSVKSGLRFTTSHASFKWLRRLPLALTRGTDNALKGQARDAVLDVCREYLPALVANPDDAERAVKWMEKLCACLLWFEVEGPLLPPARLADARIFHVPSAVPEERSAMRRVEEWDEAFRSLEVLLRQGLVSSFVIVSELFSVTVFGEGGGPWQSAKSGEAQRPTHGAPCAILCPSQSEIRTMLQENHVEFDVADISKSSSPSVGSDATPTTTAIVPAVPGEKSKLEDNLTDLRDLRRIGEQVLTPDEMSKVKPPSTALWFDGAWRVHGMLDVLRQYFLRAPLESPPSASPKLLPRLVAPVPFSHAAVHAAEVVKTQTLRGPAAAAVGVPGPAGQAPSGEDERHTVELSGCFFPGQVRRLLELLRVPLPSFTCRLASEPRHSVGINAFTQLGMYRLEGVRCERSTQHGDQWRWEFELAGG